MDVSMIGSFADEFPYGTPNLGSMLAHDFSSDTEINSCKLQQAVLNNKQSNGYSNLTHQQENLILQI